MASILTVDDSGILRDILRAGLESLGHEVVGEASCGAEALERYRQLRPDLVTLDIIMAGGSGLDYLEKILQTDALARVVMVTALSQEKLKQEALAAGAIGFITKPFEIELLRSEIEAAISKPPDVAQRAQELLPCRHE